MRSAPVDPWRRATAAEDDEGDKGASAASAAAGAAGAAADANAIGGGALDRFRPRFCGGSGDGDGRPRLRHASPLSLPDMPARVRNVAIAAVATAAADPSAAAAALAAAWLLLFPPRSVVPADAGAAPVALAPFPPALSPAPASAAREPSAPFLPRLSLLELRPSIAANIVDFPPTGGASASSPAPISPAANPFDFLLLRLAEEDAS